MRLSTEKIKQGILHPEQFVRDAATSYFAMELSDDRAVMPLAVQALEQFGPDVAFSDVSLLQSLAQSDESIAWIADEFGRLRDPVDQAGWEYTSSLSWILAESDAALLKRNRDTVLGIAFLNADARRAIEVRTRLLSANPDTCWNEFEQCCRTLTASQQKSTDTLARAYQLLEVVGRHPDKYADRILTLLGEKVDRGENLARAWMQVCAVRVPGQMRLEAAVPDLIRLMQEVSETWVYDDCVVALTRIGSDAVVKAVWNACAVSPDHFRQYAAWVLESIHGDLSVEAALHLFESAEDLSTKTGFGHALLSGFAVDGIAPVRHLVLNNPPSEELNELRDSLVAVCTLMEAELPEMEAWRAAMAEEVDPPSVDGGVEFPVVDTWSSQVGRAPSPSKRPASSRPLVIPKRRGGRFQGVGRNDPCPCNSGKKYKSCCMRK